MKKLFQKKNESKNREQKTKKMEFDIKHFYAGCSRFSTGHNYAPMTDEAKQKLMEIIDQLDE